MKENFAISYQQIPTTPHLMRYDALCVMRYALNYFVNVIVDLVDFSLVPIFLRGPDKSFSANGAESLHSFVNASDMIREILGILKLLVTMRAFLLG